MVLYIINRVNNFDTKICGFGTFHISFQFSKLHYLQFRWNNYYRLCFRSSENTIFQHYPLKAFAACFFAQ